MAQSLLNQGQLAISNEFYCTLGLPQDLSGGIRNIVIKVSGPSCPFSQDCSRLSTPGLLSINFSANIIAQKDVNLWLLKPRGFFAIDQRIP